MNASSASVPYDECPSEVGKMSLFTFAMAVLAASVLGWLAGMLTFKRSLVWCAACGRVLACLRCLGSAGSPQVHSVPPHQERNTV